MSVGTISLTTITQPIKIIGAESTILSIWSGTKERVVFILNQSGLVGITFSVGFAFGMATVCAVDNFFQSKREGDGLNRTDCLLSREDFKKQMGMITTAVNSTLLCTGTGVLIAWGLAGKLNICATIFFCSLAAGFIFGVRTKEYYNNNSDSKIDQLVKNTIKEDDSFNFRQYYGFSFRQGAGTNYQIDLSSYNDYLRWLNLDKLRKKVNEQIDHKFTKHLVLSNCGLTNSDLKRLGEADWFNNLHRIDISKNPLLNGRGIQWIGTGASNALKELNLSETDLTDDDLKQMAESGYFNKLETLIIRGNPQITCRGLGWITERGFEGLKELSVSGNNRLFIEGLDNWAGKNGFRNLEVLDLSRTDIREDHLSRMIAEAQWVKNLKGIDLSCNSNLTKLPNNISELINLDDRSPYIGEGVFDKVTYFSGHGIFVTGCNIPEVDIGVVKLIQKRKIYGSGLVHTLDFLSSSKSYDLKRLCEIAKISFEEVV